MAMKSFVFIAAIFCCSILGISGHIDHPLQDIRVDNVRVALDDSVHLSVTPSVITSYATGWIEVTFSGEAHPSGDDWIGIYTPNVEALTSKAPTRWQKCEKSAGYKEKGSGSLRFRLINLRADFIVGFFSGGLEHPVLKAYSSPIVFANPDEPMQGHLALTHDPTEMRLSWGGGGNVTNYVKWGPASKSYLHMARASTTTYTVDMMCGAPANDIGWISPGPLHTAVMTNLVQDETYYYVYGNSIHGWSPEYSFESPIAANPSRGIKLIAYGDMGVGNVDDSEEHAQHKAALNTSLMVASNLKSNDLVLHIGDISYARGYGAFWDQFMQQMVPVATRVPYMTLIGNHERDYPNSGSYFNGTDSGGECGIPYEMRFDMPRSSLDSAWYSIDVGNVHFVMMSTEHDFRAGSIQHEFLSADLAKVDRQKTPWIIFSGHRPMYIDSGDDTNFTATEAPEESPSTLLRHAIEPMLIKFKVDLVLWGHHHSYQRTCPIHDVKCGASDLPVHIVIGMAGAGFSGVKPDTPSWIRFVNNDTHGYSTIETTESELHFKFFANGDNRLVDQVVLHKS